MMMLPPQLLLLGTLLGTTLAFIPPHQTASPRLQNVKIYESSPASMSTDMLESAGTKYSGAGPVSVDMNQYNLPLDQIMEEWTATLQPETAFVAEGVYLGAKSSKENMVDTVKVSFPRKPDTGLGILLQEIAGGRGDGLGITMVEGLVEGGAADGCGILEGDCISKIAIQKRRGNQLETDEDESVSVECLGYDATVDTIIGLPAISDDEEVFVISVKRLRRRPRVNLTIQYPGEPDATIQLFSGENLRRAMLTRGIKLNDPLARRFDNGGTGDCGAEATCATCAVSVLKGGELLNPQGTQEEQMLSDNPRWRLSCRAIVGYGFSEGDMTLRVNPKQWADKE